MWYIKNMLALWGLGAEAEPAVGRPLEADTVVSLCVMCPAGHGVLGVGEEEKSLNQARF